MNIFKTAFFRTIQTTQKPFFPLTVNFSSKIDIKKLEEDELIEVEIDTEEARLKEEEIQRKRNKSRLYSQHRNTVNGEVPHAEPQIWQHETLKYKRRMYGIYGSKSGVNPSMCWPTNEELRDKNRLERVTFPYTIDEVLAETQAKRTEEFEVRRKRQEEVSSKAKKLDQWIAELNERVAKKETEAKAARDRKDRLVEEVRRHFGYKVDPKEDKFKEMLEKKEKAEKKLLKEAKRKAKEDKLVAKLNKANPTDKSAENEAKTDKNEQN